MSGIDLDAMKDRWTASNRRLDEQLHMDVEAMRRALAGRTRAAFRRHSYWLGAGLVTEAIVVAGLVVFMIGQRSDWRYLLMAAPLALLAFAELVVGLRQWRALSRMDLSAPLLQVRAKLDVLRARRLRMTKWIMLSSVLLWWPAVLVLLKGLLGIELLRYLHPSVATITVVVGLAFIPLALGISHLLNRRFSGSPGYQRFLQDAAGKSWSKAEDQVQASMRFEAAVASGKAEQLLRKPVTPAPVAMMAALASLKHCVLSAILCYAGLLLLTGLFHLLHGGQALFIVAGVLLNLIWIPQMVAAIIHRDALTKLDFSNGADQLRDVLSGYVAMRARVARTVIAMSPVLLLPILAVVLQASTGIDVLSAASAWGMGFAVACAVSASMLLVRIMRRGSGEFFAALVEGLLFGAQGRTRNLLALQEPEQ